MKGIIPSERKYILSIVSISHLFGRNENSFAEKHRFIDIYNMGLSSYLICINHGIEMRKCNPVLISES